jgi:FeS assembly SUF system regulator
MLHMSKLTDYGTVIMTYMACGPGRVLSAQEVASAIGLELPTVSKVLKKLTQGKLLYSQRGSQGGYRLARTPEEISVAEIIDIMEGAPMGLTECSSSPGLCTRESICAVRANWQQISRIIRAVLGRITLAELSRPTLQAIDDSSIRRKAAKFQEVLVEG